MTANSVVIEGITDTRIPITIKQLDGWTLIDGLPISRLMLCAMACSGTSDVELARRASILAGTTIGVDGLVAKQDPLNIVLGEGAVCAEGYEVDRVPLVRKGLEKAKSMMDDGEVAIIRDGGAA